MVKRWLIKTHSQFAGKSVEADTESQHEMQSESQPEERQEDSELNDNVLEWIYDVIIHY